MFGLTLVDHLRLTFGHVIYAHRAHMQLAWRHARLNRVLLGVEAVLMFATALASIALITTGQMAYAVIAAVAAPAALVTLLARLVFDFERTAAVHRASGARLWHIRERYRALLADLQDGHLTIEAARSARDELMKVLHETYENAPPADRRLYEAARRATANTHEEALSDEDVDRFLPVSLQKGGKSAA